MHLTRNIPAHAQHNRDVQSRAPTKVKHQTSVLLRLLKVSKGFDPKKKSPKGPLRMINCS